MTQPLRESLKMVREPKEEFLEDGRYKISHQLVNDRSPGQVRAEGESFPVLIEVFDGDSLTYEQVYKVHSNDELRHTLDGVKESISRGEYAAKE